MGSPDENLAALKRVWQTAKAVKSQFIHKLYRIPSCELNASYTYNVGHISTRSNRECFTSQHNAVCEVYLDARK